MTTIAETLRGLPYFADLPDKLLQAVCAGSEQVGVDRGTVIIEEGTDSVEMYVVVEGELVVTKRTAEKDVELARLGPGEVVGEIALLDGAPRTATVEAVEESTLIKIPMAAFEDLLKDSRVVRRMFRTVTVRLREIEETLRHEERMAALGRMAAQLMHELNNPAAAVARSTQELLLAYTQLGEATIALAGAGHTGAEVAAKPESPPDLTALERADAEDGMVAWLTGHGVTGAWDIAPGMVDAGWSPALLDEATRGMAGEQTTNYARWIGIGAKAEQLIGEIAIGAGRISELVRVVKDYSFVDRGPIQEIDPTSGIKDTLILLKHKLRNIEVVLDFEDNLGTVDASGRDLNQVWTNLIDNAADAMGESGTLTITAAKEPGAIVISVGDTGAGIADEIAERIFDPFYTTKEPGKGTGLGLHTVHSILRRIGGEIDVESSASGTTFTVRVPTRAPS